MILRTGFAAFTAGLAATFVIGSGFGVACAGGVLTALVAALVTAGAALVGAGFAADVCTGTCADATTFVAGFLARGLFTAFARTGGVFFTVALPCVVLTGKARDLRTDLITAFFAGLTMFLGGTFALAAFTPGFWALGLAVTFCAPTADGLPAIFFLMGAAGRTDFFAGALAFDFATRGSSDRFR